MRNFDSFESFAVHLLEQQTMLALSIHEGLEAVAQLVEKTAKREFGTYQEQHGPFGAWPELADSTKEDRLRKGYTENDPLLRTGELRDSIEHETAPLETVIGSRDEVMVFHEFGTSRMAARAVLGPAVFVNKERIRAILGAAVVNGFVGATVIHPSLGYDFETG